MLPHASRTGMPLPGGHRWWALVGGDWQDPSVKSLIWFTSILVIFMKVYCASAVGVCLHQPFFFFFFWFEGVNYCSDSIVEPHQHFAEFVKTLCCLKSSQNNKPLKPRSYSVLKKIKICVCIHASLCMTIYNKILWPSTEALTPSRLGNVKLF